MTFVLHFAHLALSLDKIGCGSEEQSKKHVFYFVLRSPCTIFAVVITDFYEE